MGNVTLEGDSMKKAAFCALIGLLAMNASATLNKDAMMGVDKTQSAQSLGHSKLGIAILGDVTRDTKMFGDKGQGQIEQQNYETGAAPTYANVSDFWGANAYVAMAIGIWHYFDFGVTLPVYYEQFSPDYLNQYNTAQSQEITGTKRGGMGDLKANLKMRFPLPETQVLDLAVIGGASFGTADPSRSGAWVREPEYLSKTNSAAYGLKQTTLRGTLAATIDFDKLDDGIPLQIHLNGGYRYVMNHDAYVDHVYSVSGAAEFTPVEFISFFAEYYWDIIPDIGDDNIDSKELTGAIVFHTPVGLDFHIGGEMYLGSDSKYISDVPSYSNDSRTIKSNGRINPDYAAYGGITWAGFLLPQDRDGDGVLDKDDRCPDEKGSPKNQGCPLGDPDMDQDGICDPWVSEKGLLDEFKDVCEGIDKCPNQAGEGDDGCPLDDPDPDKDGICDPWVAQKKMQARFKDVCTGSDNCPGQKGPAMNLGCPMDNPDADGDKICDPWVSQKNKLADFAEMCKGYDECPGEAGPVANKGCPWPDPDVDGDGLCDEWVTQKKMGYFFENSTDSTIKKCKGLDKCPNEYGPADNDGCPLENPDPDSDGVCDSWVSEKKMEERFAAICTGIDKCPTEKGSVANNGCPMDNPDADGDSLCDPWVSQKKMLDQVKNICHGIDKCPAEPGPAVTGGCPTEDPDIDKDSVCASWVTEKGMLDVFKNQCHGVDKCPLDAGPADNNGCPLDNPDQDKDGVCDAWVTQKKMLDRFKDVCTGIDHCPLDSGSVANKGCPVQEIKENVKLEGVTFKSGSSILETNAKKVLKQIAEQLLAPENSKVNIEIHGHTDNVGKPAKNKTLSQQRAQSVVNYLASQGVPKSRMKAFGHGDEEPVADNSTAEGREQNRRIEMHRVE